MKALLCISMLVVSATGSGRHGHLRITKQMHKASQFPTSFEDDSLSCDPVFKQTKGADGAGFRPEQRAACCMLSVAAELVTFVGNDLAQRKLEHLLTDSWTTSGKLLKWTLKKDESATALFKNFTRDRPPTGHATNVVRHFLKRAKVCCVSAGFKATSGFDGESGPHHCRRLMQPVQTAFSATLHNVRTWPFDQRSHWLPQFKIYLVSW
jgi:hypothetical protein